MKDPVELFYAEPGKITKTQAENMVSEALRVITRPRWRQRKGRRGVIRAEAERGRMYAVVNIYIDDDGIKINYADSDRMRFREHRGKRYIRDIYNKWIMSLTKELKRSAQYKYRLKLVNAKNRKIMQGLISGKALVVIAVRVIPENRKMRHAIKWSSQISEFLAETLNNTHSAEHVFSALELNRETGRYVKGGRKKGYNKLACDANESQGVITVGAEVDHAESESVTSEEMSITYYNCETGQLVAKRVNAAYKDGDAFDLQTSTLFHVDKLLKKAGF